MDIATQLRQAIAEDEAALFFAWASALPPIQVDGPTFNPARVRELIERPSLGLHLIR